MAKEKEILLSPELAKKKEVYDEQFGKNRLKLMGTVKCPKCNKFSIIKQEINTAENIPSPLTADDLPLGVYLVYKCKTKNCGYEKRVLINAEM